MVVINKKISYKQEAETLIKLAEKIMRNKNLSRKDKMKEIQKISREVRRLMNANRPKRAAAKKKDVTLDLIDVDKPEANLSEEKIKLLQEATFPKNSGQPKVVPIPQVTDRVSLEAMQRKIDEKNLIIEQDKKRRELEKQVIEDQQKLQRQIDDFKRLQIESTKKIDEEEPYEEEYSMPLITFDISQLPTQKARVELLEDAIREKSTIVEQLKEDIKILDDEIENADDVITIDTKTREKKQKEEAKRLAEELVVTTRAAKSSIDEVLSTLEDMPIDEAIKEQEKKRLQKEMDIKTIEDKLFDDKVTDKRRNEVRALYGQLQSIFDLTSDKKTKDSIKKYITELNTIKGKISVTEAREWYKKVQKYVERKKSKETSPAAPAAAAAAAAATGAGLRKRKMNQYKTKRKAILNKLIDNLIEPKRQQRAQLAIQGGSRRVFKNEKKLLHNILKLIGGELPVDVKLTEPSLEEQKPFRISALIEPLAAAAPPDVRNLMKNWGDAKIVKLRVCRVPLNKKITALGNLISKGYLKKQQEKLKYDDFYHLYMDIYARKDDGQSVIFAVEKNEKIKVSYNVIGETRTGGRCINIPITNDLTVAQAFKNTENSVGPHRMYIYDLSSANCQVFITDFLRANNLLRSKEEENFIMQDVNSLLPSAILSMARGATNLANRLKSFFYGKGLTYKGGVEIFPIPDKKPEDAK